jgi:hypothetical protein
MKRIFLAALTIAAAYTVTAQEVVVYKTNSSADFDYSAQVPATIRANFQASYPTATTVTWMPVNSDWWYATYKTDKNRIVRVYYNTEPWHLMRGNGYKTSLPVFNTYVPDMVVTNAINSYGNNLYSITRRMSKDNEDLYHVTIIKNGVSEIVLMNGQGMAYNDSSKGEITKTTIPQR